MSVQTMRHDFHTHLDRRPFRSVSAWPAASACDLIRAHGQIDAMLAVLLDGRGFMGASNNARR